MPQGSNGVASTLDDVGLVERCREGDREAFAALMRRHTNLVGSIAYNITRDLDVSRDITQETFLKVHRKLDTLTDTSKFRPWLCGIARTTSVDWLRREKVRPMSLEAMRENGEEPVRNERLDEPDTPTAEREELYEKVLMAVNSLPEIYQEVMLLKHLRKLSYQQIGEFLNLPLATVESRLYRAKLLLKERLANTR